MYRLQDALRRARDVARPLDTSEIDARARRNRTLSTCWGGVFPADVFEKLAPVTQRPVGYVVNTDPSSRDGKHWVCFYFPREEEHVVEFYDSYGLPPAAYSRHFSGFLARQRRHDERVVLRRSDVDAQDLLSAVCGYYALGYVYMRCVVGLSMPAIVRRFPTASKRSNDRRIAHYVNERLPKPVRHRRHPVNQTARKKHQNNV